jgi:hypothetical protein
MRFTLIAILAELLGLACGALAQSQRIGGEDMGELNTDRPGFSVPANVVAPGIVEIETGISITSPAPGQRIVAWGNPLIRLGISNRVELRVSGSGVISSSTETNGQSDRSVGWSDFSAGAKIAVTREHRLWPAFSLIPSLSMPSGSHEFTSRGFDPGLTLVFTKSFTPKLSLNAVVGYASASDLAGRMAVRSDAAGLWYDVSRGRKIYLEFYEVSPPARLAPAFRAMDAGITQMIGRNLQIDAEAGRDFNATRAAWFAAFGFATRADLRGAIASLHRLL